MPPETNRRSGTMGTPLDFIAIPRYTGVAGEIDLRNELDGEVFEPLKDLDSFRRFSVDPGL